MSRQTHLAEDASQGKQTSGLRGFFRKLLAFTAGMVLLAFSCWLLIPPLIYPTTSRAVINARLMSIEAPYPGTITKAPPETGEWIAADEVLLQVENPSINREKLEELRAEAHALTARINALQQEHHQLLTLKQQLQEHWQAYRKASEARMDYVIAETDSSAKSAEASTAVARTELAQEEHLSTQAASSDFELKIAQSKYEASRWHLLAVLATSKRYRHEKSVLDQDLYMGAMLGRNDVPYSQQRTDEIRFREFEIQTEIANLSAELEALQPQINEADQWNRQRAVQQLKSPVDGLVWKSLVFNGSHIDQYVEVVQILDPSSLFVEAAVSSDDFEDIAVGDAVRVDLSDTIEFVPGTVVRKLGTGVLLNRDRLAADLTYTNKEDFRVHIQLERLPKQARPENIYCVGCKVEVRFLKHRFSEIPHRFERLKTYVASRWETGE